MTKKSMLVIALLITTSLPLGITHGRALRSIRNLAIAGTAAYVFVKTGLKLYEVNHLPEDKRPQGNQYAYAAVDCAEYMLDLNARLYAAAAEKVQIFKKSHFPVPALASISENTAQPTDPAILSSQPPAGSAPAPDQTMEGLVTQKDAAPMEQGTALSDDSHKLEKPADSSDQITAITVNS